MAIGMDLKIERIRHNIKQYELAYVIGINPIELSLIENGRKSVDDRFVRKYREAVDRLSRERQG